MNVAPRARNGIIRGFKVTYSGNGEIHTIDIDNGEKRQVEIKELEIFTEYAVTVLAFTTIGDGPESLVQNVSTDESSKSTNVIIPHSHICLYKRVLAKEY